MDATLTAEIEHIERNNAAIGSVSLEERKKKRVAIKDELYHLATASGSHLHPHCRGLALPRRHQGSMHLRDRRICLGGQQDVPKPADRNRSIRFMSCKKAIRPGELTTHFILWRYPASEIEDRIYSQGGEVSMSYNKI
ncbi:MAG: YdcH family protein [Acidithiobacillus sp.]|nr:YdcH family protein [Acidithiobacillus sp.]